MIQARWVERSLKPLFPLGTSKGTITERTVWYLIAWNTDRPGIRGIGEAAPFPGHSLEYPADVRSALIDLCAHDGLRTDIDLTRVPSVRFALEACLKDLEASGSKHLFPSTFTFGERAIPINGLVWMGNKEEMRSRMKDQVEAGNRCVKMKIGALAIQDELELLRELREEFTADDLTIRVDANGAFHARDVYPVLDSLAALDIHSIEQPVPAGSFELMEEVTERSPVPIALDEDLIGLHHMDAKTDLLDHVRPHFIVIKPSLVGGWQAAREWIDLADARGIGWWITSALESNIGLNAIAQWVATLPITMPQGLGTGKVYANNIPSPLYATHGELHYRPEQPWDVSDIVA